jgi:hypothetical protein
MFSYENRQCKKKYHPYKCRLLSFPSVADADPKPKMAGSLTFWLIFEALSIKERNLQRHEV